jgi:phage-related protein
MWRFFYTQKSERSGILAGNYDGSLVYDTKIDSDGFKNGLSGLKSIAKGSAIAIGAVGTAAAGAFAAISTGAIKSYADFEQLTGGVETLFKGSADTVKKYAQEAYKSAGLSANEYMETVTSFSASLLQSLGGDTEKAAKYADQAITDMSDNANKMGSDMTLIQNAYQGFAKQNYTMLDNLKLGYGGTKTEMQRLIKEASKLDKTIKANDMSFANIVKSIHAVQTQMGITGTTAKEAATTIQGSIGMMKGAWKNLLTGIVDANADLPKLTDELVDSVITVFDNLEPAAQRAISGVGKLLKKGFEAIVNNSDKIIEGVKNTLLSFIDSLTNAIPIVAPLGDALSFVITNAESLTVAIIAAVAAIETMMIIQSVTAAYQAAVPALTAYTAATTANASVSVLLASTLKPMELLIGILTGKIQLQTAATLALAAAKKLLTGHIGLLITGVVAATGAIVGYIASQNNLKSSTDILIEQTKERRKVLEEEKQEYDNLKQAQTEQASADLAQIAHTQVLYQELKNLVGANGEVTEANQGRVQFILGELNSAYGTEYSLIDGVIKKYKDMQTEIDNLIEKKKYQIVQEAALPLYEKAITDEMNLRMAAAKDLIAVEEQKQRVNQETAKLDQEIAKLEEAKLDAAEKQSKRQQEISNAQVKLAQNRVSEVRARIDEEKGILSELEATYQSSSDAIATAMKDITTYESAMVAASEGNYAKASQILSTYTSGFSEAMKAAEGDIEKQKEIATDYYIEAVVALEDYAKKYKEGTEGYTAEGLKTMTEHAAKMKTECEKVGVNINDGIIAGLDSRVGILRQKIQALADMIPEELKKLLGIKSPSRVMRDEVGKMIVKGMAVGIDQNAHLVEKSAEKLAEGALKAVQETQDSHSDAKETIALGEDFAGGFATGIENGTDRVMQATGDLAQSAIANFGKEIKAAEAKLKQDSIDRSLESAEESRLMKEADLALIDDDYLAKHPEALYEPIYFGVPGIKASKGVNFMDAHLGSDYWDDITPEQLGIHPDTYKAVQDFLRNGPNDGNGNPLFAEDVSFNIIENKETGENEVLDVIANRGGFKLQVINHEGAPSRLIEVISSVFMPQATHPGLRKLYEYMAVSDKFFSGEYASHLEDVLPDNAVNINVVSPEGKTRAKFNRITWLDGTTFDAEWKENSRNTSTNSSSDVDKEREKIADAELRNLKHQLAMEEITQEEYYGQLAAHRDKYYAEGTAEHQQYTEELYQMDKDFLEEKKNTELRNLKHQLAMGKISEKEYYNELAKFRDKYFEEGSAEWQQYTEELYQYRQNSAKSFEDNLLKEIQHMRNMGKITEEDYYKALTKYRDTFLKEGSDEYRQYTEEIYGYYKQLYDKTITGMDSIMSELQQKQKTITDNLYSGMAKSVARITIKSGSGTEEYYQLADNSEYLKQLDTYLELIEEVKKKRGELPTEVLNSLKNMDVTKGIIFAKEILNAKDEDWEKYVSQFSLGEEKAAKIAMALTETDADEAMKLLGEKYSEIPQDFFDIGGESANSFTEGFVLGLNGFAEKVKQVVGDSMSLPIMYCPFLPASAGGGAYGNTYTSSYNFYSSADTTTQQLNAAKNASVMKRLQGR